MIHDPTPHGSTQVQRFDAASSVEQLIPKTAIHDKGISNLGDRQGKEHVAPLFWA